MSIEGLLLFTVLGGLAFLSRVLARIQAEVLPWYRDASLLFTLPWVVGAIAYLLPLFVYREPLELRHVAFIALCHLAVFVGAMTVRFLSGGASPSLIHGAPAAVNPMVPDSGKLLWGLALAGLMGQVLICAGGMMSGEVSLIDRLSGDALEQTRLNNFLIGQVADAGGPFVRFNFLGSAAFVFLFMYVGGSVGRAEISATGKKALRLVALVGGLLIIFNALFIRGGRMELALLVMGCGFAALLDEDRHFFNAARRWVGRARVFWAVVAIALSLSLVWYLATGFTKSRIGTASAYAAMEQYHRAKPSAWLEQATGGNASLEFAALNLSYLTVPTVTLGYYYDLPESLFPGPFFGQYNFTGPVTFAMRRVGLRDEQHTLQDIRLEVTRDLRMRGYGDNVWSTVLRDLALDVGWWGIPPTLLIVAGLIQKLLLRVGRTERGVLVALAPLMILFLVFSAAHSLFVLESFAVALYMCLLITGWQFVEGRFQARHQPAPRRFVNGRVPRAQ